MPIPRIPFLLLRHGETELNALRLCCGGGVDTKLTDTGRAQADAAGRIIAALPPALRPTLIIHSGMSRTRETATRVNAHLELPQIEDNALREHMLGVYEHAPWDDVIPLLHDDSPIPDGETTSEYTARVRAAITRLLGEYGQSERVLFVAHGGTFHSLMRLFDVAGSNKMFIPNAIPHLWQPDTTLPPPMPWRVSRFEADGQTPAPFCPTQEADKTS